MSNLNASSEGDLYFKLQTDFFNRERYITNISITPTLNLDLAKSCESKAKASTSNVRSISKNILKAVSIAPVVVVDSIDSGYINADISVLSEEE